MSTGGGVLLWMDDDNVSSACDDVNRDQQYGRGSTWTGSPIALPLASYVAISGWGYTSIMRALQVDRLQRRRELKLGKTGRHNESSASGTWQTGAKVSAQARPSQWNNIRLALQLTVDSTLTWHSSRRASIQSMRSKVSMRSLSCRWQHIRAHTMVITSGSQAHDAKLKICVLHLLKAYCIPHSIPVEQCTDS